ncbi:unnamed protein product [Vitrella brassicaformis CCMP3155]|uniref:MORN repeat-containing protein 3 n=1 Tax=Vitrella brassicaformis (strain CCMP3155) TaxID=1169540 RepID=A0A0G4FNA1_VITBC|nr:unnamed protein product [Vitrella brassicaformis CCMP3155]|eukprot:CEM15725.1 unnamed protein product [Vitrella brassicaformis CCMP3155]
MLQNVIDDLRRSTDRERRQYDKRIEELEAQRDDYKRERDAYRRERDAAFDKLRELEAKIAADEQAHSNVARTVVHDGGLYHGSIRKVGGTEVPHGTGLLRSLDGERKRYEGEWKDGKHHGKGKEFSQDRAVYEGDFVDGKREGHGEEFINGKVTYRGVWVRGEKKGAVVATGMWWEGHFYHGPTLDGRPHGEGELRDHHDKIVYKGQWTSGRGQGEEFDSQGRVIYRGEWADGKRHGRGKALDDAGRATYEGEWTDGKRHGQGKAYYNIGYGPVLWFDGEWREGLAHSGTLFPDGDRCGLKNADGIPRYPITPIRWQAGQKIPNTKLPPSTYELHHLLQSQGLSGYFPAGAL